MKRNAVARWVIAASLFVAGSCAPVSQGLLAGPHAPYDTAEAEKTFLFGYNSIVERHLDRVTAATIAIEGMRGLAAIDPEIGISRMEGKLLLTASDRIVAEYPEPLADDVRAWARMTVTVALEARGVSAKVKDADLEKVYESVFDATLAKLDMFSRYSGAKEAREHRASRNGFGGVGIKFDLVDGEAKISEIIEESPAVRAGLAVGDVITHIDGQSVSGLAKDELSTRLRGPVNSDVQVTLRRGFKPMDVTVHRDLIVPPTVTMTLNNGVAEFKITGFNQRTASSLATELKHARDKLGPALTGVVLDMRGNPGGLLDQAVTMSDLFIKDGPIVSTRGRHPLASQAYEAREGDMGEDLPVVVLVDGKSASAAEILTAALQDAGRAVVIGTNSYGKGTVQTVLRLPNDGEMTLTWSRFHTPSGYALHGLGVLPTICTADDKADPGDLAQGIVHAVAPAPVTANLSLWRHAKLEETDLRKQLRATCPSAKHGDAKLDMELAQRILATQGLYERALSMSAPAPAPSSAHVVPAVHTVN
ncbi:MAG TPA: S41 family peptidase [Candidatus Omnitrophota bacterium]|nr:S41 family peptidase [Candidatus Omnitrophota bacterium]